MGVGVGGGGTCTPEHLQVEARGLYWVSFSIALYLPFKANLSLPPELTILGRLARQLNPQAPPVPALQPSTHTRFFHGC